MDTPAYNGLNFTQRMAVRHAVFKQFKNDQLTEEAGNLDRALEAIATDPEAVERAVKIMKNDQLMRSGRSA